MREFDGASRPPCSREPGDADIAAAIEDTPRVADLRRRVRLAMEQPPVRWHCPERIDPLDPADPVAVRKARAMR